jgi:hypothetical protein
VGRGRGDCDAAHEILKTNMKTIIYQSYDIIVSIYQVYTWYIPCINLVYDDVKYIVDIHLLKTFCDILVPVTLRYGHGIYQVYT